jgi:hypothetical protein
VTEIFIHRTKCAANFTHIPNEIFDDRRLGGMALAILTYILRRPPHWRVRRTEIMDRFGIGKDAFYSYWNELKAAGYVRLSRQGGKARIHVYDRPQLEVHSGKPGTSSFRKTRNESRSGKPGHLVSTESESNKTKDSSNTMPLRGDDGDSKKEAATENPGGIQEHEPIVFSEGVVQLTRSQLDGYKRTYPALALTIEAAVYTIAIRLRRDDWEAQLEARLNRANGRAAIERQQRDIERQQLETKRREPKFGENYL